MDLLDRLLGHDRWTTTQLLERCRELRAEQWTQPFDVGHETLVATFQHMIGNVRVWTDLMAERPIQPSADEALTTADLLLAAWQRVYTDFATLARRIADERRWDATYSENATWTFPGHHPLSGTKVGIDAIIAFFDAVGLVMGSSHPQVEKLVMGVDEQYVVECQHIRTNWADGPNLDQQLCVLWSFAEGKIVSGQHLTADQDALDAFYTALLKR